MSEGEIKKRHLILLLAGAEGGSATALYADVVKDVVVGDPKGETQSFVLKEEFAREALEMIFAAEAVGVWGEL